MGKNLEQDFPQNDRKLIIGIDNKETELKNLKMQVAKIRETGELCENMEETTENLQSQCNHPLWYLMDSYYDGSVYATFIETTERFKSAICIQCDEIIDNVQLDSFTPKKVIDLNTICCMSSLFAAHCNEGDECSFENVKDTYNRLTLKNKQSLFKQRTITNTDVLREIRRQIKKNQKQKVLSRTFPKIKNRIY